MIVWVHASGIFPPSMPAIEDTTARTEQACTDLVNTKNTIVRWEITPTFHPFPWQLERVS